MVEISDEGGLQVLTVTQLTRVVRELLEGGLGHLWVEGEISNHRLQASGHQYFTLKDDRSQLSCVMFKGRSGRLGAQGLEDGMQVQAFGLLTVYEARGQYQLNVQAIQARGAGALQARFEALKRQLQGEGLFDADRKLALPWFPTRIGIVTSPTGAAIRDMLQILERRAPWLEIYVYPARVQGEGAASEVARGIEAFGRWGESGELSVDVVIVGRGGGSLEDLWAFNEEVVARAIAASDIPIISAVGHEIDFTIADFVADLRAPTPSAAAEMVAPERDELLRRLSELRDGLGTRVSYVLRHTRERLRMRMAGTLAREPGRRIRELRMDVDAARETLDRGVSGCLELARGRLRERAHAIEKYRPEQVIARVRERLAELDRRFAQSAARNLGEQRLAHREVLARLRLLGPAATLERGYSITVDSEGKVVRSRLKVQSGERIRTHVADGEFDSEVL